ncbi:hypothetical protein AB0D47_20200 [Streptomyces sp. NPDC048376]
MSDFNFVMSCIAAAMAVIAIVLTPFVIAATKPPRARTRFDRHAR